MMGQRLLKRKIELRYRGDTSANERVVGTVVSGALAYLKRTTHFSLTWARANIAPHLSRVPSGENTSDILTKQLDAEKFVRFRTEMGIFYGPARLCNIKEKKSLAGIFKCILVSLFIFPWSRLRSFIASVRFLC